MDAAEEHKGHHSSQIEEEDQVNLSMSAMHSLQVIGNKKIGTQ